MELSRAGHHVVRDLMRAILAFFSSVFAIGNPVSYTLRSYEHRVTVSNPRSTEREEFRAISAISTGERASDFFHPRAGPSFLSGVDSMFHGVRR